jgi:exonuclease-1
MYEYQHSCPLLQVVKMLRFNGTPIPKDYEVAFQRALWAFRHCRVYCAAAGGLVHLEPLPPGGLGGQDVDVPAALPPALRGAAAAAGQQEGAAGEDPLSFLGPALSSEVATGIAKGEGGRGLGGPGCRGGGVEV